MPMTGAGWIGGLFLMALSVAPGASARTKPDVYILAGQSNMSGRGLLADLRPDETIADPGIMLYGNDGRWRPALDPLDDATGQIDEVSSDHALPAVGPGLTFARTLRMREHRPVALVPCAKGGSSITLWKPDDGRSSLFGSCIARVREAGGHLAGILWYQGESDAERPAAEAGEWPARFTEMIAAFRQRLGAPRLPVVFVRIGDRPDGDGDYSKFPNWPLIQSLQTDVHLPCAVMVSAGGLPRKEDHLHLTTEAQRTLGIRLAEAMGAIRRQGCR
jgi:hypothetical protein